MTSRRFPPPWTVEETAPCFIVRDHNGQALAFVYCEDEPGRRATGKLLTRDEARRIAVNIAKLPDCCGRLSLLMRFAPWPLVGYPLVGMTCGQGPLGACRQR
jgi:hypothetical protein